MTAASSTVADRQPPAGFHYRDVDRYVVDDVFKRQTYRRLAIQPGDVVLDLGAHVGAFTTWALQRGAGLVVAVEMVPGTVELLRANHGDDPRVVILDGAVVGRSDVVEVQAWTRGRGNPMSAFTSRSTRAPRAGDQQVAVRAFGLHWLLVHFGPRLVKFDIETAEYEVITPNAGLLAACGVRALVGEHHVGTAADVERAQELHAALTLAGYEASRPAPEKPSGWGTVIDYALSAA